MRSESMIKVEAIAQFTLGDYNKITNLIRKGVDKDGMLFVGDIFECSIEMAKYLTGKNNYGKAFVRVIEVKPEKKKK